MKKAMLCLVFLGLANAACPAPRGQSAPTTGAPAAVPAGEKKNLYVRPFGAEGVEQSVAAGLADKLCSDLAKSGRFEVLCSGDIAALADHQAERIRAGGCDEAECDMDLAAKLKVERLVKGTLRKVGSQLVFTVIMVDGKTGQPLAREVREVPADQPEKLLDLASQIGGALTGSD